MHICDLLNIDINVSICKIRHKTLLKHRFVSINIADSTTKAKSSL